MKFKEYQSGGIIYTPFITSRSASQPIPVTGTPTTSTKKTSSGADAIQKEIIDVLKENGVVRLSDCKRVANSIIENGSFNLQEYDFEYVDFESRSLGPGETKMFFKYRVKWCFDDKIPVSYGIGKAENFNEAMQQIVKTFGDNIIFRQT